METIRKPTGNITSRDCFFLTVSPHRKTLSVDAAMRRVVDEDNPRHLIENLFSEYLIKDARRGLAEWHYAGSVFAEDVVSKRDELEILFHDLADRWRRETGQLSSMTQIVLNQSYQQIIGLGSRAIPLLLAELRREPDHWFWALSAITREDPVDPENAGDVERMAEDWLAWGSKHGYMSK